MESRERGKEREREGIVLNNKKEEEKWEKRGEDVRLYLNPSGTSNAQWISQVPSRNARIWFEVLQDASEPNGDSMESIFWTLTKKEIQWNSQWKPHGKAENGENQLDQL